MRAARPCDKLAQTLDDQLRQRLTQLAFYAGLAVALIVGAKLRLPDLDLRPMHTDEAIQAVRFGELLEEGSFGYMPDDGHGPGLLYFTLPVSYAAGADTYREADEKILRTTPALFGLGIIALTCFAFRRWLGAEAAIVAGLLAAVSPMMGFYSRYYIMEVPLVFFLLVFLVCAWRYLLSRQLGWLIAAGLCGAIMHATKETFGISIVALLVAVAAVVALVQFCYGARDRAWLRERVTDPSQFAIHLAVALPISLIFSAALFSVWFDNPAAIADSYKTYGHYFSRGTGPTGHEKPFLYYLRLLFYTKLEAGFKWSEALTLILSLIGIIAAFALPKLKRETRILAQILAIYTMLSFLFYSAIPYKTPWSILSALHAAMIMAGFGFYALLRLARMLPMKIALPIQIALAVGLSFGVRHLGIQSHHASFPYKGKMPLYAMEARNPYVYGHTTTGFVNQIVKPMRKLLAASPEGERTLIRVIHSESAWPIPYYFRQYDFEFADTIQEVEDAPIILTEEHNVDRLIEKLGDEYTFSRGNLREEIIIYMFYKQSLFDLAHPDL